MAKLRQNHSRGKKKPFAGMAIKLFVIFGILALLFILAFQYLNADPEAYYEDDFASANDSTYDGSSDNSSSLSAALIPEGNQAQVVNHRYYTLGYNEDHEQPDWVTYSLTKASLKIPNVPRAKRFTTDPMVKSRSAKHNDYSHSGYTRGHMAPAGDMAFNESAMQESFFMSNMSPQLREVNGGIWRELEETVRDWAYEDNELFIASGPIFDGAQNYIGKSSKVRIPAAFYKIIVDIEGSEKKGVAYIIPHESSDRPLNDYALSIDEVESKIGLDFFDNLYEDEQEERLIEASFDKSKWPTSQKRYKNRRDNWNNN